MDNVEYGDFLARVERGKEVAKGGYKLGNKDMVLGVVTTLEEIRTDLAVSPGERVQAAKALFDVLCGGQFPYEWFEGES